LHELLLHFFDVFIFGNSSVGGVEQKEAVELAIIHPSHVKRYECTSLVMPIEKGSLRSIDGYALLMFWGKIF